MDSNGDGIGDFPGLLSKLDYLQDLGVTCLWLLPFFPSPLRDDGYDIANYVDVNPSYGTLDDFKQVLDAAHQRGMQVMIELVINHTTDQHPWFKAARLAPKGSPERDMYVWRDTDKLYEGVRIIFTDTEKSNWTWDEVAQQYYWHRFFSHQPDLNFDNPRVMEEVLNAMRFWLDMGVDALRLDAIPYLVERDGTSCENVPETHVKIKEIRAVIDAEYENRLVLAEANMWPADVRPYFGDGDECHMAFHFPLMPRIYMALRQEDRLPITDIMAQTPAIPDNCQWGLFLRNHDELTLEMVTNDERDYMYFAYSADPRMRINVGIRRRLAPLVDNNRRRIELLNSLLLSFPGTPILYYGDEIGMGDNIYLGDRNGVRTPMQWNSDRNAGFSTAVPAKLYFPVIMDPIWGYQSINVEAQQSDQSSLLHWTRNMIALRKLFQVFGRGTQEFLNPDNRKILAYIRAVRDEDGNSETVLCVANLSRFAQPVSLDLSPIRRHESRSRCSATSPSPPSPHSPIRSLSRPTLSSGSNSNPPLKCRPEVPLASESESEPILNLITHGIDRPPRRPRPDRSCSNSSPPTCRTSAGSAPSPGPSNQSRSSTLQSSPASTPSSSSSEITYDDDSNSVYQLALSHHDRRSGGGRPRLPSQRLSSPQSPPLTALPSCTTRSPAKMSDKPSCTSSKRMPSSPPRNGTFSSAIAAVPSPKHAAPNLSLRAPVPPSNPTPPSSTTQNSSSSSFAASSPAKIPIPRLAASSPETAHFPRIAPFLGEITLNIQRPEPTTIAMLQGLVENEGDGWQWTLDELSRYYDSVATLPAPQDLGIQPSFLSRR